MLRVGNTHNKPLKRKG